MECRFITRYFFSQKNIVCRDVTDLNIVVVESLTFHTLICNDFVVRHIAAAVFTRHLYVAAHLADKPLARKNIH